MSISTRPQRGADRPLYRWAPLVAVAIVFAGFAKTFYLKQVFGAPPLSALLILHGVLMTTWFVLFIVQTRLVAARRTDLHRRLGVVGALLALAILIVGPTVAVTAAKLGHTPGPPPLVFLVVPLGDMVVFALLVGSALLFRRRSDVHKRLMLLSFVGLLTAAIARLPVEAWRQAGIVAYFSTTILLVLMCVGYDTIKHRRLHPAFAWGAGLIILSWPLRLALTTTATWMAFATWLTS
ncbi:hypothetical protein [Thermomonas sp.]|uniref:hypothetical protein n=1 Tax=Thermomonas sp. TaxID=1971895 RepID=UPI002487854D|nr:hypothetical protein [Thermomonas sp.]MDI1254071.1 hypothetical protein [Thermomonas sp.]